MEPILALQLETTASLRLGNAGLHLQSVYSVRGSYLGFQKDCPTQYASIGAFEIAYATGVWGVQGF